MAVHQHVTYDRPQQLVTAPHGDDVPVVYEPMHDRLGAAGVDLGRRLDLDEAAVTPVVAAIVAYGYAVVARWLEQRVPSLRVLLGLGVARKVARYDTPTR